MGNAEEHGYYLYACNTGTVPSKRRILRYRVADPQAAIAYFRSCVEDRENIQALFKDGPSGKGLTRCSKSEQPPRALDKAAQKRANCPLTSRKACLLAMLWSCSRPTDASPEEIRKSYKATTTLLREHGVREAIALKHPALLGKGLLKMLTKVDRPRCHHLAWELALAIREQEGEAPPKDRGDAPQEVPPLTSDLFMSTVSEALARL